MQKQINAKPLNLFNMKKESVLKSIPIISLTLIIIAKLVSNSWINNNYLSIITTLLLCSCVSFLLLWSRIELHKKILIAISIAITLIIFFVQLF
jgi:hypothetical protein